MECYETTITLHRPSFVTLNLVAHFIILQLNYLLVHSALAFGKLDFLNWSFFRRYGCWDFHETYHWNLRESANRINCLSQHVILWNGFKNPVTGCVLFILGFFFLAYSLLYETTPVATILFWPEQQGKASHPFCRLEWEWAIEEMFQNKKIGYTMNIVHKIFWQFTNLLLNVSR